MEQNVFPSQKIFISKSPIPNAGKGVFASKRIKKDEVIEECPVFVLPQKDYPVAKKTILRNYYFMWGKITAAICFGFGSFYNHSYEPNATYKKNIKEQTINFIAIKDIDKGEEIVVNYNYGKPEDKKTLWIKEIKPVS
ncbi:MAG: SET domain-containing protein [Patescibacteria group bacterium]